MRSSCRIILKKGKESQKERQTETNKQSDLTTEKTNKATLIHVILNSQ